MTANEEQALRAAARAALALSDEVVVVSQPGDPDERLEPFTVFRFTGTQMVGIIVPEAWFTEEGTEEACQAILRQESKALAGQAPD